MATKMDKTFDATTTTATHLLNEELQKKVNPSEVPFWTSQRLFISLLSLVFVFSVVIQRVNLSIAMVCMVRAPGLGNSSIDLDQDLRYNGSLKAGWNDSFRAPEAPYKEVHVTSPSTTSQSPARTTEVNEYSRMCAEFVSNDDSEETGEFEWSKEFQGLLLGSVFWGYLLLQVPGGMLSETYGPRLVMMCSSLPCSVLTLLGPVSARASPWLFMVTRILQGAAQSTLFPSVISLLSKWCPPNERGKLVAMTVLGGEVSIALMLPIGGFLCGALGWASIFYVTGAFSAVWCVVWFVLVSNSPAECPRISKTELDFLQQEIHVQHGNRQKVSLPLCSVLKSGAFHGILVAHLCYNFSFYMLFTQMPTYMAEVLKFDITSNGLFSMLPYLTIIIVSSISSVIADLLLSKKILSCKTVRKLFTTIGCVLPAICLLLITVMDCTQQVLAVALLCGCVGFSGAAYVGFLVNHADIAPQYAGTLFGITNCIASLPGIIAPYLVGVITANKTQEEWRLAFYIAAGIILFGAVVYLFSAQGSIQKWAVLPDTEIEIEVNEKEENGTKTRVV